MLLFYCYDIIFLGGFMKIAVDKKSINYIDKTKGYEYIYIFDDESIEYLIDIRMKCIEKSHIDNLFVDVNLTEYDVECIKKADVKIKGWDDIPDKVNYKIGIIIPNFNYEHTIEKCISSILSQTYNNYEIIFVDDMSNDNSIKIVESFKDDRIKIVKLKQKRYNGGARNEAYLHLSDDVDYVYYVDSDDWLYDENVLEKINQRLQNKPDVLFVGLADYKNGVLRDNVIIPTYKDKYEAIKGWSGSCGKVIKKSLATRQGCLYNEGTLKEDRNQHCKICIYMKDFRLLKEPIYVWNRDNNKSITTIRDDILWGTSTIRHYADTLQLYLSVRGDDKEIDSYLEGRVKATKDEMKNGGDRQW